MNARLKRVVASLLTFALALSMSVGHAAPAYAAGEPVISNLTITNITSAMAYHTLDLDSAATVYKAVYLASDPTPTVAAIKAGTGAVYSSHTDWPAATDIIGGVYLLSPSTAYKIYFVATNANGDSEIVSFSFTTLVAPVAPLITTDKLPGCTVGSAYSTSVEATGTTPMTWKVVSGSLPPGLVLDSESGLISGTPTAVGTFTFTVEASNEAGSDSKPYTIAVAAISVPEPSNPTNPSKPQPAPKLAALPPTGDKDSLVLLSALEMIAAGAALLMVARKFRTRDIW